MGAVLEDEDGLATRVEVGGLGERVVWEKQAQWWAVN